MDTPIDQAMLPSDGNLNDPADFLDDLDFMSKFEVIPSQPGDPNFVGPIALVVKAVREDAGTEVLHKQSTRTPDDIVSQYIYLETLDAYLRESDKQILKPTALNRVHKLTYPGGQHRPAATTAFDTAPDKRVASGKGWLPIANPIIELDGVHYANTYAGIQLTPELGDGDITDPLARWVLAARVEQSTVHLISISELAVTVRVTFLLVQLGIEAYWIVQLGLLGFS